METCKLKESATADSRVPKFSWGSNVCSTAIEPMCYTKFITESNSEWLKSLSDSIKDLENQYPAHGEEYDKKRSDLKKKASIWTPLGYCEGTRTDTATKATGDAFLDIDHYDGDIQEFMRSKLTADFCHAQGIWFATVSIGGDGGHIHFHLRDGETPSTGMQRIADALGITEYDSSVKNVSRCCFMTPQSYWIVTPTEEDFYFATAQEAVEMIDKQSAKMAQTAIESGEKAAAVAPIKEELAESTDDGYYSLVVKQLVEMLGGEPEYGNRHNTYTKLLGYTRSMFNNDAERMYRLLPSFGLPEDERRRACDDICKSPDEGITPHVTKTAMKQVKQEQKMAQFEDPKDIPLPPLPQVLETILKYQPENYHTNTILCALPALGALAHNCTYYNFSNYLRHFGFGVCLIGPPASGKSFYKKYTEALLKPLREHDAISEKEMENYRKELKLNKNARKQPKDPETYLSIILPDTTLAKYADYLKNAKGDTLYMESDEVDEMTRVEANKISTKKVLFRRCFDGTEWGQDRAGNDSITAKGFCKINTMIAGTAEAWSRFIDKQEIENGLSSRWIFTQMPPVEIYNIPYFKDFTTEDKRTIENFAEELYNKEGTFYAPFVTNAIREWQISTLEAHSDENEYFNQYVIRAAEIGERAGLLYAIINDTAFTSSKTHPKDTQEEKDAVAFALWVARMTFANAMKMFYNELDKLCSTISGRRSYTGKYTPIKLYNDLPTVFTREDIKDLGAEHDRSFQIDTILCRWRNPKSNYKIMDNGNGSYTKVK